MSSTYGLIASILYALAFGVAWVAMRRAAAAERLSYAVAERLNDLEKWDPPR